MTVINKELLTLTVPVFTTPQLLNKSHFRL